MDRIQETLFQLLVDIDKVCSEHNLSYFLGKETALCAQRWGHFPQDCHSASIFMPADDYLRFEELMTAQPLPNRTVESLKSNPSFPYLFMRFVDTESTYISLCSAHLEQKPGIHVDICKLQPYTKYSSRFDLSFIRAFGAIRYADAFSERRKSIRWINQVRIDRLEKNGAEAIARLYEKPLTKSKSYEKVYVQRHYKDNLYFKRSLFESKTLVQLEGHPFPIPECYQDYLSVMYGRRWASREISFTKSTTNLLVDPESPYSEYLPLIAESTDKINRVVAARAERNTLLRARRKARKPLDRRQRYYYRAVDRVKMEDLYLPQKQELVQLYKDGNFEELTLRILDYQAVSEKYSRWSMGFAFDKELYVILCDVLAWERMWSARRHLINLTEKSFTYLDELNPESIQEPVSSLYECTGVESGLIRIDGTRNAIPVATVDQIDKMNAKLRHMIGDDIEPDDQESEGLNQNEANEQKNMEVE